MRRHGRGVTAMIDPRMLERVKATFPQRKARLQADIAVQLGIATEHVELTLGILRPLSETSGFESAVALIPRYEEVLGRLKAIDPTVLPSEESVGLIGQEVEALRCSFQDIVNGILRRSAISA